jgi:hypothetical protein
METESGLLMRSTANLFQKKLSVCFAFMPRKSLRCLVRSEYFCEGIEALQQGCEISNAGAKQSVLRFANERPCISELAIRIRITK